MTQHSFRIIPIPGKELFPDSATDWLSGRLPAYLHIAENALACPDQEIRDAVRWLVQDLQQMVWACGEAIQADGITTLVECATCEINDAGALRAVPLILAAQQWGAGTNEEIQRAYGCIAIQLAKRLEEIQ